MLPFLGVPVDLNAAFGKALRQLRKQKGLTQEAFEPTTVRTYISNLERGVHSPSLEKVESMSEVLGVSPAVLLSLTLMNAQGLTDVQAFLAELESGLEAVRAEDNTR